MLNRNIETFIACDSEYGGAKAALFGAPFDGTVSYRPGARFGPKAMRGESFGIETYSPYQRRDLLDLAVFDCGDLELPFGSAESALKLIEDRTARLLDDGKLPVMLGGEHLVTLGAFRAVYAKCPGARVLHFDAHADLRDDYLGDALSHAAVMRRVWELTGDGGIYQFGIRSGERAEFDFAAAHTNMTMFGFDGLERAAWELAGTPVYFTLDLDILDPSVLPGTGTPEPGGVSFRELLDAVLMLKGLNVVGLDICELSPHYDQSGASTAAACKILRELLLVML
ncbi:MAG: agmatinase [Oscillospiraceae bacterium]|jgi:agmatinase|nr:agmatinase [Oscillospiraceae bacterium]